MDKVHDTVVVMGRCADLMRVNASVGYKENGLQLPSYQMPTGFPRREDPPERLVCAPGSIMSKPSMLLTGLEELAGSANTPLGVKLLEKLKGGATAIFAVSGNGKTRLAYELLAKTYGFYFSYVPRSDAKIVEDQGSSDFSDAINGIFSDAINGIFSEAVDADAAVHPRIWALVACRAAMFLRLMELTKNSMTPYQWLLVQLFPKAMLGDDVFRDLFEAVKQTTLGVATSLISKCGRKVPRGTRMLCFVDEAQHLATLCQGTFEGNVTDPKRRPLLSPVASAFFQAAGGQGRLHHPVFCGTGLSMEAVLKSLRSKVTQVGSNSKVTDLAILDEGGVERYLGKYVDWELITNPDVKTLVLGWVRGRPRFAATFFLYWLDEYRNFEVTEEADDLQYFYKYKAGAGLWTEHNNKLLRAIDRFRLELTTLAAPSRRFSNLSLALVPYQLMQGIAERAKATTESIVHTSKLVGEVKTAVAQVALGLSPFMTPTIVELVELGICCLVRDRTNKERITLTEPLMVEAGVACFGLADVAKVMLQWASSSPAALGDAFEVFVSALLPNVLLKDRLCDYMGDAHVAATVPSDFKHSWRLPCSCFGVLVERCAGPSAAEQRARVVAWCDTRRDASCAGLIPPIMDPDTLAGPDHVVDLRLETDRSMGILAGFQDKFRDNADMPGALCTTMPELFYHKKRTTSKPIATKTCEAARGALQRECGVTTTTRTQGFLRIVVIFPAAIGAKDKAISKSGGVNPSEYPSCGVQRSNNFVDLLLVYDANNIGYLISEEDQETLKSLKIK